MHTSLNDNRAQPRVHFSIACSRLDPYGRQRVGAFHGHSDQHAGVGADLCHQCAGSRPRRGRVDPEESRLRRQVRPPLLRPERLRIPESYVRQEGKDIYVLPTRQKFRKDERGTYRSRS